MTELHQMQCEACRVGAPQVTDEELTAFIKEIPDWQPVVENDTLKLQREFSFANFIDAMAFSQLVGELAETFGHHPAILTEWGKTTVTWWTHKIQGLHKTDFIMAAKTDRLHQT
ncbi:Putative pterin-4-alpha-carbinolamine dehydratase [BD1-7 clade bacterium]|uniref:Putative pterin-4-alpha-carbinolamine dehydratase n=1 Tax=BD1-7 clade bacterium TaxID=2029982 RepID=A0A5S9NL30_9GAMM|nr:Putative pterin-4-alpha-carbinolamine dehydratase [BD1-7 clade bacterium]CAA0093893.1 Putative pterin-4-alpha-carbinolamine dehydratase [BD1-7 clade bacterium]